MAVFSLLARVTAGNATAHCLTTFRARRVSRSFEPLKVQLWQPIAMMAKKYSGQTVF
jgi:hypothetical protein